MNVSFRHIQFVSYLPIIEALANEPIDGVQDSDALPLNAHCAPSFRCRSSNAKTHKATSVKTLCCYSDLVEARGDRLESLNLGCTIDQSRKRI